MIAPQNLPGRDALFSAVESFGRFRKRWAVLDGFAKTLLIGLGLLLFWSVADHFVPLPAWPLIIGFALVMLALVWAAFWLLARIVVRRSNVENEALEIERRDGKLDNQLIGAMQLADEVVRLERMGKSLPYSAEFVRVLVAQTAADIDANKLKQLIDLKAPKQRVAGALAFVAIALGLIIFAPDFVNARTARLHDAYLTVLDSLFPVDLRVSPGNLAVVRGRPVDLQVEVLGARRPVARLFHTIDVKAGNDEPLTQPAPVESVLELDGNQKASFRVNDSQESFTYFFEYANRRSEDFRINVESLPELQAINYELVFPAYTSQPPRTLVGRVPKLKGLSGTGVLVSFAATTALHPDMCYALWQDGTRQALTVSGRYGHFSFTIDRPERVEIHLTGHYGKGFEMAEPIRFEVNVQRDQPPTVATQLKARKLNMLVEEATRFSVAWTAEDDFGVEEVTLNYKIDTIDVLLGRPTREGLLAQRIEPARDRAKGVFTALLKDLSPGLEPGDRITITLSARDNNTETGPSVGKSLPIEIVVVRPDLAAFVEQKLALGGDEAALGGLQRIKRATDLLVDPQRTVRTQFKLPIEAQAVRSRVGQESWPSGSEDAVGDYFRLLSGEK